MVRIEINNFQSIARQVVEVNGFSALAGRSNIGKSAVVRAIKAALTGSPVDGYVRHGPGCPRQKGAKTCKCFCSVHITAEGFDLLWQKGDTINKYVHNGVEHTVVGRGTPDFLLEGFAPVKLGDEKDILQVADQFKPIFILDKPGTVAADILSDVAKLDQINVAMRMAEKDRKEAKATRRIREQDVLELRTALLGYEGLDDVVNQVTRLEELDCKAEEINTTVKKLNKYIASILILGQQLVVLKEVGFIKVPDIESLLTGEIIYENLERFLKVLQSKLESVTFFAELDNVKLPDFESFLGSSAIYENLIKWSGMLEMLRIFFNRFQKLSVIVIPDPEPLQNTAERYFLLDRWNSRVHTLAETLLDTKEELKKINQEKDELEAELGVCPSCNRPFAIGHQHCQE